MARHERGKSGSKSAQAAGPASPGRTPADAVAAVIAAGHGDATDHELDNQLAHRVPALAAEGGHAFDGLPKPDGASHHVLERAPTPTGAQPSVTGGAEKHAAPIQPAAAPVPPVAEPAKAPDAEPPEARQPAPAPAEPPVTAAAAPVLTPTPRAAEAPQPAASRAETPAQPAPPAAAPPKADTAAPGRPAATAAVPTGEGFPVPDLAALTQNMGKLIDFGGKVAAAYLKPREKGEIKPSFGDEVADSFKTMGKVAESWFSNPTRMLQAQADLTSKLFGLWGDSISRFGGGSAQPTTTVERVTDKRFASPEWRDTPMHDFLHQAYLTTTNWAKQMVDDTEGVDAATREKAAFYLRQVSSALSPANFLATNPELIKDTFRENGANLVRGMQMLAEDIEAGRGELKIRQSDASKFKLGVDMASTPGKVVFRNELMELIQYAPATDTVLKRPILIVPPWINKFYVLDLNKEKSFIRWMVSQGLTVFVISWVNPDERHAAKDWDAYMREGIFTALDNVEKAVGAREVTAVGYCVGGTLLAATLAYMAAKGDRRIASATLLTTQVDFQHAGDLKVFADESQIRAIETEMQNNGYLPGSKMANAFNMLRPDELIWSYAVNTYIKGKPPAAFDLLAWNADSTRMTAANHAYYLRNLYLENRLTAGEMVMGGERLNLGLVTVPIYDLAAKEDHIAPARSVFNGARFFGGDVRYVLAGSGHIAGVVNPPAKAKYQYWSGGKPEGRFEDWVASAHETKGTWWLDWIEWIKAQAPETVPPRDPSAGGLPPLGDAPGEYVRVTS